MCVYAQKCRAFCEKKKLKYSKHKHIALDGWDLWSAVWSLQNQPKDIQRKRQQSRRRQQQQQSQQQKRRKKQPVIFIGVFKSFSVTNTKSEILWQQ